MWSSTERLIWDRDGRDWPNRETSRFVEAAGLTWHVQRSGRGPVLLLLHGTGATTHSWRGLLPLLARHFDVIAPDLPGHGFTSAPPDEKLGLDDMSSAVAGLLRAMDVSAALVVGHSAGAAIAAAMSLEGRLGNAPVIGINAALLPFAGWARHVFPPLARLLYTNRVAPRLISWRARDPRLVTSLIEGTGSKIDAQGLQIYARLFRSAAHVSATLTMMARWDLDSLEARLSRLAVPLVLIVGGNDRAIPADEGLRVVRLLPQARSHYVREAGHLAHEERPDEIAALIVKEAARLEIRSAPRDAEEGP